MADSRTRRPGELVFTALLAVFSLLAAWQAWLIAGFSSPSSPGVFPMLATAAMVVSGVAILADTARKRPAAERGVLRAFLAEVTPARLAIFAAMIIAYMFALEPVGFVVSSFVFLFAAIAYLYRGSIVLSLAISALSLAAIYFVFRYVFSVVLPTGSLI